MSGLVSYDVQPVVTFEPGFVRVTFADRPKHLTFTDADEAMTFVDVFTEAAEKLRRWEEGR